MQFGYSIGISMDYLLYLALITYMIEHCGSSSNSSTPFDSVNMFSIKLKCIFYIDAISVLGQLHFKRKLLQLGHTRRAEGTQRNIGLNEG